jgi:hypothetical protein
MARHSITVMQQLFTAVHVESSCVWKGCIGQDICDASNTDVALVLVLSLYMVCWYLVT